MLHWLRAQAAVAAWVGRRARRGRGPPRLLLGDGTLEAINISLTTTIPTVHVIRTGPIIDDDSTPNFTSDGLPLFPFGTSFAGSIYTLYTFKNELFLFGCNLTVMLVEDINESNPKISAGCTSICSPDLSKYKGIVKDKLCFGIGCCQAEIAVAPRNFSDFLRGVPTNAVQLRSQGPKNKSPWQVFLAKKGWFDDSSNLTKADIQNELPVSGCITGYDGNPYLPGASGCRGLIIGIAIGSGVGSILYVLLAIFMTQKFKHLRAKKLKQKYFKQNRGQLLQHLVSQNTVIAERMIIPVDELAKVTNNFDKARKLGGGGHGTVYKGILSDQHVVAIKKSNITVQREIDEFLNEVAILSQINHRNIVKLFGCCLETEVPLLVYEFISNGTLYQHLHVEGPRQLPWGTRLRIAVETSSALAYLHSSVSMPIIHRDIKSSNILLDDTLTTKVSDFGASRYIPIEKAGLTTRVQGTIGYLDPMYFYTGRLTEKSDVYSFGVMLVELLTRKKPFSYLSLDDESLVSHFVNLLDQNNLVQILDPLVVEEGDEEVHEVAILAASCIKLTGEDRPRMQQVEHALKGIAARRIEENGIAAVNCSSETKEGEQSKVSSRRYSMEQEFLLSASFPR
ncbi:putative wall-associated receptor kinase-like 16 [Panicum virgatum]|uniref:putative wall-associated receptor kinase-like 16 n=1 Tax=Panicum virgatum TaxID=38727 RepID=UPI0019D59503|nr:putative wall-associated receptor kinase-like 16 [Panicum virgatum]